MSFSDCRNARDRAILCCLKIPSFCDKMWAWLTGWAPEAQYAPMAPPNDEASLRATQPVAENNDAFLDVDADVESLAAAPDA